LGAGDVRIQATTTSGTSSVPGFAMRCLVFVVCSEIDLLFGADQTSRRWRQGCGNPARYIPLSSVLEGQPTGGAMRGQSLKIIGYASPIHAKLLSYLRVGRQHSDRYCSCNTVVIALRRCTRYDEILVAGLRSESPRY